MYKLRVNLADCRIGNILAEDIINDNGIILVAKNTVLNPFILLKLSEIGIGFVHIYDMKDKGNKPRNHHNHVFESNYLEAVTAIKELLGSLASGKRLELKKMESLKECIFKNINDANSVIGFLNELKTYDDYTYYHSANVAFYAMLMGKWTHMPEIEIKDLILSGCLHDIGKITIPNELLNKKERLTWNEFEEIKEHSKRGYMMVKDESGINNDVKDAVLSHHERMDGSGYPAGSGGASIGQYANIIAIADVYDAMTSERVYKHRTTPFEAFRMFSTTGVCQFDPYVIKVFSSNMASYMYGLKVQMSDGQVGEIVYVPINDIANPVVSVNAAYIDMSQETNLKIQCIL
jgi:HD-GYP domain-containing protein (c-di-GMP phosphodiesterase class II)